jgi:hypothetical protein
MNKSNVAACYCLLLPLLAASCWYKMYMLLLLLLLLQINLLLNMHPLGGRPQAALRSLTTARFLLR